MAVVLEAAVVGHQCVERALAFVPEGGVAEVVRERNGFGEVFVEAKRAGDVAGDCGYFHRVREPRAQVVAGAV